MPTPEEIKKIAREVASQIEPKKGFGGESYWIRLSTEIIEILAKDYCLVPKELIRKEYGKAQKTHDIYTSATCINEMESRAIDHAEGRMCELTTLFGKSLLKDEKGGEE